eukprot:scaffold107848_cov60-Phaeocystis_antarctica.AAC.1
MAAGRAGRGRPPGRAAAARETRQGRPVQQPRVVLVATERGEPHLPVEPRLVRRRPARRALGPVRRVAEGDLVPGDASVVGRLHHHGRHLDNRRRPMAPTGAGTGTGTRWRPADARHPPEEPVRVGGVEGGEGAGGALRALA